ncbi:MAG: His-Xaa-Ser system radical SAM maturase HxsB, partial [Nitrospirae bacterium]
DVTSDIYPILKAKHFITEKLTDSALDLLSTKYRTKKSFLFDFTTLHMFVVTVRCNQKCVYCHASSVNEENRIYDMNTETAEKTIDICLNSAAKSIKIEFQGGEPLLNFEIVRFVIDNASKKAVQNGKTVDFVLCSNLTAITDDMLKYLADNNVSLSTSLDGPAHVHDFNRYYRNGTGTYESVIRALNRAKKYLPSDKISALMTTTKYSLKFPHEIIDEYVTQGFKSIFVRMLNPFGFAKQNMLDIGYTASDFSRFYKDLLQYVISINVKGYFLEEAFASLLLTRILTPFSTGFVDMQFPAGTGISGVIYGHDGNVYPSDEARMLAQMGDNNFCMGNVNTNTYRELFKGKLIQDLVGSTCAESLPGCSDCVFQLYCGIDPIRNYATQYDIIGHRPSSEFCYIQKDIIKHLFDFILKNNSEHMDVFWSWLTGRHISEIVSHNSP